MDSFVFPAKSNSFESRFSYITTNSKSWSGLPRPQGDKFQYQNQVESSDLSDPATSLSQRVIGVTVPF